MPRSPWPWKWQWQRRVFLKEWRHAVWEKSSPVILAIVVIVAGAIVVNREIQTSHYAGLAANYGAQIQSLINRQNVLTAHHHQQNVLSQTEIMKAEKIIIDAQRDHAGTLNEIAVLEAEVSKVIEGLPAADTILTKFAISVTAGLTWLECRAGPTPASCGPQPPPPQL